MRYTLLTIIVFIHTLTAYSETLRVKSERAMLRIQPSFKVKAVGLALKGDILTSTGKDGAWVQLIPPPGVFFWISEQQIQNGRVSTAKAQIRTGPGPEYPVAEELVRGEPVDSADETKDKWLKIVPPKSCRVWSHNTLFEPDTGEKHENKKQPGRDELLKPETPQQPAQAILHAERNNRMPPPSVTPDRTVRRTELVDLDDNGRSYQSMTDDTDPLMLIDRQDLVPLQGQGATAQYEGTLRKNSMFSGGPADYRLVRVDRTREKQVSLCYVIGNSEQLAGLKGRNIIISGREYWLKGCSIPTVVLTRIGLD